MKLLREIGSTSQIFQVFIRDSSSTTGAGLTGLVFNSGSLTAYYHRDTDTTATAISLATMTVGTFTSSGFKEIDATNMPGWYQFCPPNAALVSGASSVAFHLKGATNMAPLPIEVDLAPSGVALSSAGVTAVWAKTLTALTAVPSITADVLSAINWVFTIARDKITQTSTTQTVFKDDGTTAIGTSTVSDDGTTFTRSKFV